VNFDWRNITGRPIAIKDTTLTISEQATITRTGGWTTVEVPTVPYAFTDAQTRLDLGWTSTLSLAALEKGRVTIKTIHGRTDVEGEQELREQRARRDGREVAPGFDAYNRAQTDQQRLWQPTTKRTFITASLGPRDVVKQLAWRKSFDAENVALRERRPQPLAPLTEREMNRWHEEATRVRDLLAVGGYRAVGVDAGQLRDLRRHAIARTRTGAVSATGRSRWNPFEMVDEFSDVEVRPGSRWLRIDSDAGSVYTATFVTSAFPVSMTFPGVEPWLAVLDRLPFPVETDLVLDLVPADTAKRQVARKGRDAIDQAEDAAKAGMRLPIVMEEQLKLARELEYRIPTQQRPLAYGWARLRVDASDPRELPGMFQQVRKLMAGLGAHQDSRGIDVAWPGGGAGQAKLLVEGIPGQPVRHKSWRQRWYLETAACSLQHAGSELGHPGGSIVGHTTGRVQRSVGIDWHHAITRRTGSDVETGGGIVALGKQRSGKSGWLMSMLHDLTMNGVYTIELDPAGPQARYADHPEVNGSKGPRLAEATDLTQLGGGVADPLGNGLIPLPERPEETGDLALDVIRAEEWEATRKAVMQARTRLTRETIETIAFRQLEGNPEAETALLQGIQLVAAGSEPSTAALIAHLRRKSGAGATKAAQHLGEVLAFDLLASDGAGLLAGEGVSLDLDRASTVRTRIYTMRNSVLPEAGKPRNLWSPDEALGAAAFGCVAHLIRRQLNDLPPHVLKALLCDELHVALATTQGRRVWDDSLRHGPKNSQITVGATHNAVDLLDERIRAAVSMWLLFRATDKDELGASFKASGLADTAASRKARMGLKNGEAIVKLDTDVIDRMRFDLNWQPGLPDGLRGLANTTAGQAVDLSKLVSA
jgi:hypothetical protein